MKLDLHVHTTASDGSWSPGQVVEGAVRARLDVIAVSDHDTTAGLTSAVARAAGDPIQIIPAVEMSSTFDGRELHLLGYFVDPTAPDLVAHEQHARGHRERRIRAMVDRLEDQGVSIAIDEVFRIAGPDRASVGRPHLARALVEAGYAATQAAAFDQWIGDDHPAFIPTDLASPWDALRIIDAAGGVAVWAHPPHDLVESLLPRLVQNGLRGLEVYRPKNHPDLVLRLERLARAHGLVMSGGSDWHGPESGTELGDFFVTADEVAALM
jgi:predicted metal-dependent phosphoesterase TrpH